MTAWTQQDALTFCKLVEEIAPRFGCHVALTGGCLYKSFDRKDLDILFYRIRQTNEINMLGLFLALESELGVKVEKHCNAWITKATWRGRKIDVFFPEEGTNTSSEDTEYPN